MKENDAAIAVVDHENEDKDTKRQSDITADRAPEESKKARRVG